MRKFIGLFLALCLVSAPAWASSPSQEQVNSWFAPQGIVCSAMISFTVTNASGKSIDCEGILLNGETYSCNQGPMSDLVAAANGKRISFVQTVSAGGSGKALKSTWIGVQDSTTISSWKCTFFGNSQCSPLLRSDEKPKIPEIGADPLRLSFVNKESHSIEFNNGGEFDSYDASKEKLKFFKFGGKLGYDFERGSFELGKFELNGKTTYYLTDIRGTWNGTQARGGEWSIVGEFKTSFSGFVGVDAANGANFGYSAGNENVGNVPLWKLSNPPANVRQAAFIFPTAIKTVQDKKTLTTRITRVEYNPSPDRLAGFINPVRMKSLVKLVTKAVAAH